MTQRRVALDVMGGDDAPDATLQGALAATQGDGSIEPERILLVGDQDRIEAFLADHGGNPGFEIRHASEVIEMGDSPARALKAKPDSSILHCVRAVRERSAEALVSMGNTGACVGGATLGLGTLEGVRRPGIAVALELTGSPLVLIDMGANLVPKPDHLVQYGAMGAVYSRDCLGVPEPRVGLLNVGEEKGKGTPLLKEAQGLMEQGDFQFVGNVEGGDLFKSTCDVVVMDGFTGNVILKLLENFAGFLLGQVVQELRQNEAQWGDAALARIRRSIDYATYGGALLLGVSGVVVIGHGRSDEKAVANALRLACRAIDAEVNHHIEQGLATVR